MKYNPIREPTKLQNLWSTKAANSVKWWSFYFWMKWNDKAADFNKRIWTKNSVLQNEPNKTGMAVHIICLMIILKKKTG